MEKVLKIALKNSPNLSKLRKNVMKFDEMIKETLK